MSRHKDRVILVVEDEEDSLILLKHAFHKISLTNPVRAVSNAHSAIAYLAGNGDFSDRASYPLPNVIMLDLKLAGSSGLEVLQWVRNSPTHRCLVVVVFTSSDQRQDIQDAYDAGANSYLVKPSSLAHLIDLMKIFRDYWVENNMASTS
ncbi:MAG TPA: response regulator [Opitutaceae bacterium]|nr:response regulator [Opitutaceae bacterium]